MASFRSSASGLFWDGLDVVDCSWSFYVGNAFKTGYISAIVGPFKLHARTSTAPLLHMHAKLFIACCIMTFLTVTF